VGIPERNSRLVLAIFPGSDALLSCNQHSNAGSTCLLNIAQEERERFRFKLTGSLASSCFPLASCALIPQCSKR